MGQPAAKHGDQVVGIDVHIIISVALGVPVPVPHPFMGLLDSGLSPDVNVMGKPAAAVGSSASNQPPHIPIGGSFSKPPTNRGTIVSGSATVFINGQPAARAGDTALTCNDPVDLPNGTVVAASTVLIG
jgi:uncharacterized Zn-binding protein involved in type VI secretion